VIPKGFDSIAKIDIDALIENEVRESRTIEYKSELPGNSDKDKREFLADVSSFANAAGGDLIYGVAEAEGIPQKAIGLSGDMDAEIRRLDAIIRTGLEPRIAGIRMRPVDGFEKGPVLLIRIPKSWAAPHLVSFKNLSRFYTRNSAGKHQMDVTEIRAAFLQSEAIVERMKRFRDERLGRIIANETPVPMSEGAKLILHILPISSFTSESSFDVSVLRERTQAYFAPIGCSGWNHRYTLDGLVTYDTFGTDTYTYALIFRKGEIEAVNTNFLIERDGRRMIPSTGYEKFTIEAVLNYFMALKSIEIPSPVALFVCLTGVLNVYMGVNPLYMSHGDPIDRDTLVLPEVIIERHERISNEQEVAKVLRPIFDAVWNACGYERSFNFDEEGKWKPRR